MLRKKSAPKRVERTQQLRASNAAGKHLDKRTKRLRTRAAKKAKAREEYEQ